MVTRYRGYWVLWLLGTVRLTLLEVKGGCSRCCLACTVVSVAHFRVLTCGDTLTHDRGPTPWLWWSCSCYHLKNRELINEILEMLIQFHCKKLETPRKTVAKPYSGGIPLLWRSFPGEGT